MDNILTIARPYAKAAFDFAYENKSFQKWKFMLLFCTQIVKNKKIDIFFKNTISFQEKFLIFEKICGDNLDQYFKNFIKLMIENKRINLIPQVLIFFIKLYNKYHSIVYVKIISSNILNKKILKNLKEKLEKKLACKIKFNFQINKSLISGIIIHINDFVIDSSLQMHLQELKNFLKKSH